MSKVNNLTEQSNEKEAKNEIDKNVSNHDESMLISTKTELYQNEDLLNKHDDDLLIHQDDTSLYDDVMSESADHDSSLSKTQKPYVKRVSCYVGNMTWWTTDKDLTNVIKQLAVNDLLEIKFYENKINGQSKGFAMVTVGSDQSFRILMEKLPKKVIHEKEPIVTHYSRHYFNQFEEQARKDMPATATTPSPTNKSNNEFFCQQSALFHHFHANVISNSSISSINHQNNQLTLNNRLKNNTFPVSISNASLNNGSIGGNNSVSLNNRSLNNNRAQTSLVNNHPANINQTSNNNQIRMPSQQQMGIMPNPTLNNNLNRQFALNNGQNMFNNNNGNQQRPILNQQAFFLGNRPPLISKPLLRPSLPLQQPQMNQMSLLTNPRMSLNSNATNNIRQDWENNRNNNFNNNIPQNNLGIMPKNSMLFMNQRNHMVQQQQQQSMSITPATPSTGKSQFLFANGLGPGSGNINGFSPMMNNTNNNGLLSNQNNSFQLQQQQSLSQYSLNNTMLNQQQHLSMGGYNGSQQQQHGLATSLVNTNQIGMNPHHSQQQQGLSHHQMNQLPNMTSSQPLLPHQQTTPSSLASDFSSNHSHHNMHNQHQSDSYSYQRTNNNSMLEQPQIITPTNHQLHQQTSLLKLNEIEFQENLEKNRIVSGSALSRAVHDASNGKYQLALETLQTAISLIKQSKISQDERCKLLISTLQDTKKGIEDRYYGSSNMSSTGSILNNNSNNIRTDTLISRGNSRDKEKLKRSHSRDSRERAKRNSGSEKHHRTIHRDRSRDRRNNGGSILTSAVLNANVTDYYNEQNTTSRYHHRSRH